MDLDPRLLTRIPELLEREDVPGLCLSLIRDGEAAWHGAFGVRDRKTGEPLTTDTLFEAASLSKPAFAYGVLQLCAEGVLDLDRPLNDYLDRPYIEDDPRSNRITTRHVLSHTSGLPNWRSKDQPLRTAFEPGRRFSYSGEGYVYLAGVVERITGRPIDEFLEDRVLHAVGFGAASFAWAADDPREIASPHDTAGEPRAKSAWASANVAASLHCTARGFSGLVRTIAQPVGEHSIGADDLAAMLSPQIRLNDRVGWGLGWGLQRAPDGDGFWHWGDNQGYRSFALGSAASGDGIVAMTNGENGQHVIDAILHDLLGGDRPALDWLARFYGRG